MSEYHNHPLLSLVEPSLVRRERLYKITGWACALSSLFFFVPVLTIPARPGEEGVQVGLFAFAVLLVVIGLLVVRAATRQSARIRELLYVKPHEMTSINVLILQSNNGIRIPTVRIVDKRGKQYGLIMPSADAAQRVVERALG